MPVNSADLSFVPKTLIAHCLTATGVNSMKRLPTTMIGDAADRTTAAVSSPAATAAPAANSATTTPTAGRGRTHPSSSPGAPLALTKR